MREMIYYSNNNKKKARVALLLNNALQKNEYFDGHYTMMKQSTHQKQQPQWR